MIHLSLNLQFLSFRTVLPDMNSFHNESSFFLNGKSITLFTCKKAKFCYQEFAVYGCVCMKSHWLQSFMLKERQIHQVMFPSRMSGRVTNSLHTAVKYMSVRNIYYLS